MTSGYLPFLRQNLRAVLFGALLTLLSSFGQTFFVALSAPGIRAEYGLSEGGLGLLYAAATGIAGLLLGWAGRLIDRVGLRTYTALVCGALALGCLGMAVSGWAWLLGPLYVVLRLSGQGLATHTAMTATARRFPRDAGKALGLVALGLVLGEAALLPGSVALLPLVGWRGLWWLAAVLVAAGLVLAMALLEDGLPAAAARAGWAAHVPLWRDRAFLLMQPAVQAPPFIMTGFLFNQVRLAGEMGWELAVWAAAFPLFALVRAMGMLLAGPVIDRAGAARLLPVYLAPLGVAMAALVLGRGSHVSTLVFMVGAGLTNGVVATLSTALAAQMYPAERLAAVRSAMAGGLLVAAAAAPAVFGLLLDAGLGLRWQAGACLVGVGVASVLAIPVARRERG